MDARRLIAITEVAQFESDGHISLLDVLPPECVTYACGAVERVRKLLSSTFGVCSDCGKIHTHSFDEGSCGRTAQPYLQLFNVWAHDEAFRDLVFCPELARLARSVLQCERVRLVHDQLLVKSPGDYGTPVHVDAWYWPIEGNACTVWIPLHETAADMGTLQFFSGTHRSHVHFPSQDEEDLSRRLNAWLARQGYTHAPALGYEVGGVSVHDKWLAHATDGNRSSRERYALAVHVMDAASTRSQELDGLRLEHIELFNWNKVPGGAPFDIAECPVL